MIQYYYQGFPKTMVNNHDYLYDINSQVLGHVSPARKVNVFVTMYLDFRYFPV